MYETKLNTVLIKTETMTEIATVTNNIQSTRGILIYFDATYMSLKVHQYVNKIFLVGYLRLPIRFGDPEENVIVAWK